MKTTLMTLTVTLLSAPAIAATNPSIPVESYRGADIPDFDNIAFSNLPRISSSGSLTLPDGTIRRWQEGQRPGEYLHLGDFEEAFQLQQFSLQEISQRSGVGLDTYTLEDFPLAGEQTLNKLSEIVPNLAQFPVGEVEPIRDLLEEYLPTGSWNPNDRLMEVLNEFPQAGFLKLGNLDLSEYSIDDIPNLDAVPLQDFDDWRGANINQVPNLSYVPFSQFPKPPQPAGTAVGTVDWVLGEEEGDRYRPISGSYRDGFNVPCEETCPHIEIDSTGAVEGTHWMGKPQKVTGGFGVLGAPFNDEEYTGRHPFGKGFKVVVEDVDEERGTVQTAMYFQKCQRGTPDLGCTGYVLGPVPFIEYSEEDPIFLGLLESVPGGTGSDPAAMVDAGDANAPIATDSLSSLTAPQPEPEFDIDPTLESLAVGGYDLVSVSCVAAGCEAQLGRYGLSSRDPQVRDRFSDSVLTRLDSGETIAEWEIEEALPPEVQNELMNSRLAELRDRTGSEEAAVRAWRGGENLPTNTIPVWGENDAI